MARGTAQIRMQLGSSEVMTCNLAKRSYDNVWG